MKDKHRDDFAPAPPQIIPPGEPPEDQAQVNATPKRVEPDEEQLLAMVPPGVMGILEKKMDARIQAALEAERPQIKEAVSGAIKQVIDQARTAGLNIPGVTGAAAPDGGVIPGSTVTPQGAELLKMIFGGGQGTQMEELAKTLNQARAISDVLNPPSIWDRVMQNAVLRSLSKAGLVTEAEVKELTIADKKA